MKIQFYNTPSPKSMGQLTLPDRPKFIDYQPDFVLLEKYRQKYTEYKNLVVIGHGGSITSFAGLYNAMQAESSKNVFLISTVDPEYIWQVKSQISPADTLVMAISKSGETVTQLEALMQFLDFPLLVITGVAGPLAEIAHRLKADTVVHPPIGGRFTGFTEVALLPAAICGFDVRAICEGGQQLLQKYSEDNIAFHAASIFWQLEDRGIVDVFLPVYNHALFPFTNLAIQLCHESFGKDGKGQTYFAHEAPESQHHTNQRFFGGRKNIAGWFMSLSEISDTQKIEVPQILKDIPLKEQTLGMLDETLLSSSLYYEHHGTLEDAKVSGLPVADMLLDNLTATELGQFMAFWQLYAVYSSLLRGVNPFDQPQVENSKKISFAKRENAKGVI